MSHTKVAVGVIGRDVAFVAPKKMDPIPLHLVAQRRMSLASSEYIPFGVEPPDNATQK